MIIQMQPDYAGPKFEAVEFAPNSNPGIRIPAEVRVLAAPSYEPNELPYPLMVARNGNTVLYVHPEDVEAIKKVNL